MCDEPAQQGISLPIPSVSLRGAATLAVVAGTAALVAFLVMAAWWVLVVLAVLAVAVVPVTRYAARWSLVRAPAPQRERKRAADRVTVSAALAAPPKAIEAARPVALGVVLNAEQWEAQWHR